ncbi:MAG: hypothetical protein K9N06_06330 [Candidatus Cloacimonetes bacterium]|nr:hypothetical protein [Candidatus Cloacimonadota bacterium]
MKKILVTALILMLGILLSASRIKNFDKLMKALRAGQEVSIVIEYGNCILISDNEEITPPDAIGGMPVDVWEYFAPMSIGNPKAFVVFSQTKLINYAGFIYNYAKIKISDDNSVEITAQYANSQTFELEMDETFFTEINNGKNTGALFIFKD